MDLNGRRIVDGILTQYFLSDNQVLVLRPDRTYANWANEFPAVGVP